MCATHSAGQGTDYVVSDGTVAAMARSSDWRLLARLAARAGYWQRLADDTGWLLVDDAEHLFHIRLKAEVQWERDRKSDVANPKWTVPVRLRDGDGCRYCGNIVNWLDRHARGGTYDHRIPGQRAETIDDLVVACRTCNSRRADNPNALPLLPPPRVPYYGAESVAFLAKAGVTVAMSTERPPIQGDPAAQPSDPAASGTTHTATPKPPGHRSNAQRPRNQRDTAPSTQDERDGTATGRPHRAPRPVMTTENATDQPKRNSANPADIRGTEAGIPGSGRGGSGRAPALPTNPAPIRKARRPRGRRGRPRRDQSGGTS